MNSSGQSNAPLGNENYTIGSGTSSSNPFITTFSKRDPTAYDFNFPVKQRWVNILLVKEWILESFSNITGQTLANWILLSSGGSIALELVQVDSAVAPGVNPVSPNASNTIDFGESFATHTPIPTGTNSAAYQTVTRNLNELGIELQLAGSNPTTSTPNNFGISQFDANQFNVNSGYVQLAGGTTPAILTLTGNSGGAIPPDSSGNINTVGTESAGGIDVTGSGHTLTHSVYKWINASSNNWTPVIQGSITPGTATYAKQHAVYSRVGLMVFFTFDIEYTGHTGTGDLQITGFPLPFALANTNYPYCTWVENITLPAATVQVMFNGVNGQTSGTLYGIIDASTKSPIDLAINTAGTIACYGFYFSDAA